MVGGKDTTGEYSEGKYPETWLPRDLESSINRYTQEVGLKDDDRLVDKQKRTVQYWIDQAGKAAAVATGDEDYRKVSTHDLRPRWTIHLLVE